jgi:uncharacterized protein
MNTEKAFTSRSDLARKALQFVSVAGWCCVAVSLAQAQTTAPPAKPAAAPPPSGVLSSPLGTAPGAVGGGPGYHDPRSAFKPLEEREGVVSWKLLGSVTGKMEKNVLKPVYPAAVKALDRQTVKVQGFMLPLEPGERQKHFLLSGVPTTCSFCIPAGPEGLVEVRTKEPIRYTVEAITVQGRFSVLNDDKFGLFYRVADAAAVP